jgi:hypothetical protein
MVQIVRRVGIAIGSLVIASLVVGLVGGLLQLIGIPFRPLDPTMSGNGSALVAVVTIVLGGLIYRDIIRKDRRRGRPSA